MGKLQQLHFALQSRATTPMLCNPFCKFYTQIRLKTSELWHAGLWSLQQRLQRPEIRTQRGTETRKEYSLSQERWGTKVR